MYSCEECGKSFHACGSCDLLDWEWHYCSKECWAASRGKAREELQEIVKFIPADKRKLLSDKYWQDYNMELFWDLLE